MALQDIVANIPMMAATGAAIAFMYARGEAKNASGGLTSRSEAGEMISLTLMALGSNPGLFSCPGYGTELGPREAPAFPPRKHQADGARRQRPQ